MALNIGNINFKNTNSLLQQMLPYLMRYKLGNVEQGRDLERLSEQDRYLRERMAEEDVYRRKLKEYESGVNVEEAQKKSKINIKEDLEKAFVDVAKSNVGYNALIKKAQLSEQAGDTPSAEKFRGEAFNMATPAIQSVMDSTRGKVSNKGFAAAMNALGDDGIKLIMDRATRESELNLERQKFGLEERKLGFEREKFGEEKAGGGKTTDYYKTMHTKITNLQRYLTSMKEYVESGADTSTISVDWKKLLAGPVTPQLLGQALSRLSKYDTKAMKVPLAPEEEAWLDRSWDIMELQKEKESGGVGSSVLEDRGGQQTMVPLTMPTVAPTTTDLFPSTAPSATPKAEQTIIGLVSIGEIRTSPKDGKQYRYLGNNKWIPAQ